MAKQFPWEHHPDLTAERLLIIGDLIRLARGNALDRHNPEIGDDSWTLGCSAYKFCCFRIAQSVESKSYDWLDVIDPSMQFIFKIGDVPIRFYRGLAEDPNAKTCHVSFPELDQLALAFPCYEDDQLVYRFAVETDFDGSVTSIKFVGLSGKNPVFCWEVVPEETVVTTFPPISVHDEGVELPAPQVKLPGKDDQDAAKDAG